jgi:hypothetical protein
MITDEASSRGQHPGYGLGGRAGWVPLTISAPVKLSSFWRRPAMKAFLPSRKNAGHYYSEGAVAEGSTSTVMLDGSFAER